MKVYCYRVVRAAAPDIQLTAGSLQADCLREVLDAACDAAHQWAAVNPGIVFPRKPMTGREAAIHPARLLVEVWPESSRAKRLRSSRVVTIYPPVGWCEQDAHGLHLWFGYGHRAQCCDRCGLVVEQLEDGGYALYRSAVYAPAQEVRR
jgi:hypothetical protein